MSDDNNKNFSGAPKSSFAEWAGVIVAILAVISAVVVGYKTNEISERQVEISKLSQCYNIQNQIIKYKDHRSFARLTRKIDTNAMNYNLANRRPDIHDREAAYNLYDLRSHVEITDQYLGEKAGLAKMYRTAFDCYYEALPNGPKELGEHRKDGACIHMLYEEKLNGMREEFPQCSAKKFLDNSGAYPGDAVCYQAVSDAYFNQLCKIND